MVNKKLYHLTPKYLYEQFIKEEGLIPQQVAPGYDPDVPSKVIFCWPNFNELLVKDWLAFNKLKNKGKYDNYVLLQVKVPKKHICKISCCHTLTVDVSGSHGELEYEPHKEVEVCLVTEKIEPKNIKPIMDISTYVAELL